MHPYNHRPRLIWWDGFHVARQASTAYVVQTNGAGAGLSDRHFPRRPRPDPRPRLRRLLPLLPPGGQARRAAEGLLNSPARPPLDSAHPLHTSRVALASYERVAYITLKSLAINTGIDLILLKQQLGAGATSPEAQSRRLRRTGRTMGDPAPRRHINGARRHRRSFPSSGAELENERTGTPNAQRNGPRGSVIPPGNTDTSRAQSVPSLHLQDRRRTDVRHPEVLEPLLRDSSTLTSGKTWQLHPGKRSRRVPPRINGRKRPKKLHAQWWATAHHPAEGDRHFHRRQAAEY